MTTEGELAKYLAIAEAILDLAAEATVTLRGVPEVEETPGERIAEALDKWAGIEIKIREALR